MIIVSQDKKSIYNFDNIKLIDVLENEIYITDDILSDAGACIGEYETEERAKEVLEQITIAYANMEIIKIPCIRIEEMLLAKEIKRNIVFEMPEK